MRRSSLCALPEPEQHAVRHDDRRAAAGFEQAQEEREEEQFGLFGLNDLEEILGSILVIEAAGKRWIGEYQRILLLLAHMVLRERVAPLNVRRLHAM